MSYSDEDLLRDDSSSSWNHISHHRRHPLQHLNQHQNSRHHPQPGSSWNPHEHHFYPITSYQQLQHHQQQQREPRDNSNRHGQLFQYQDKSLPAALNEQQPTQTPQKSWYATLNLHRHGHRRHTQQILTSDVINSSQGANGYGSKPSSSSTRRTTAEGLTRGVSMSQLSKSQHQLNYGYANPSSFKIRDGTLDQEEYALQLSANHRRRMSEDESYLLSSLNSNPSNNLSSSSHHHSSFKPNSPSVAHSSAHRSMDPQSSISSKKPQPQPRVSRANNSSNKPALPVKPIPPVKPSPPMKPPRNSIEQNNSSSQPRTQMHQSKSQRNLATYEEVGTGLGWQTQKSVDSYSHVPPPEGYGNVNRSFDDGVGGYSALGVSTGLHTSSSGISSLVDTQQPRGLIDPYTQEPLYDEIGGPGLQSASSGVSSSRINSSVSSFALQYNSNSSSHHSRSSDNSVDQQSLQLPDQVFAHSSRNKPNSGKQHLRSKSEHHHQSNTNRQASCPSSTTTNKTTTSHLSNQGSHPIYEQLSESSATSRIPVLNRDRSCDRVISSGRHSSSGTSSSNSSHHYSQPSHQINSSHVGHVTGNWVPPPLPPLQYKSQPNNKVNNNGSSSSTSYFQPPHVRLPSQDEYALVTKPPTADIALKSIRNVIKSLAQEYKKSKNQRHTSTVVEERLFSVFDATGKKVSIKSKTMEHIPLLRDMSVMTDPLPEDFFLEHHSGNTLKASKVTSSGDENTIKTRSLRRTKHANLTHFGSQERRKKKLSLQSQKASHVNSNVSNGAPYVPSGKETPIDLNVKSGIVIKTIDIKVAGAVDEAGVGKENLESEENKMSSSRNSKKSPSPNKTNFLPFDDRKEWAEIESIIASFGGKSPSLTSPSSSNQTRNVTNGNNNSAAQVVIKEEAKDELKVGTEGVRDFLFSINLPDYTPLMIAHGFDDVRFMGSNVMMETDLKEVVGVKSGEDVKKILSVAKRRFPRLKLLDKNSGNSVSVEEWLTSLSLEEYCSKFKENGFTDMNKTRKIWDFELNAVLDITKVGHRRRILASLGERTSLLSDLGLDDLDRSSTSNSVTPEPLTTIAVRGNKIKETPVRGNSLSIPK